MAGRKLLERLARRARRMLVVTGLALVALPVSSTVLACPVCFSAANERVLKAYYLTAAFLTVLPFAIIGLIIGWVVRRTRTDHAVERCADAVPRT